MTKRIMVCALVGLAPGAALAQVLPEPAPTIDASVAPTGAAATGAAPTGAAPTGASPADLANLAVTKLPSTVAPTAVVPIEAPAKTDESKNQRWYQKLAIRGYTQLRYSRAFDVQGAKVQLLGDSAVAANQTFSIRRARLILSGDVSNYVSIYVQPDFAASVPGVADATFFAQLRDWYADVHFDRKKEFRVRLGQSKVPFGFENMQSSQIRLPLDRSDALNSAVKK